MKFENKMWWLWAFLAAAIGTVVLFMASGCEILKNKKTLASDSASFNRKIAAKSDSVHSGQVSTSESTSKAAFEWWKTTIQYPRDTTINNFYNPPATVIYEGGKGTKEESSFSKDSIFYNQLIKQFQDSLSAMSKKIETTEKSKQSETKGVGLLMFILIALGVCVVTNGAGRLFKSFKIVRVSK
jgi:hypothetical protein